MERLIDGGFVLCSVSLCLNRWLMTQFSNKFVPCEKLLTKNALYQPSVRFLSGSCNCTMPWRTVPAGSRFCRLTSIIVAQGRIELGLHLEILEYEDGRVWTYLNR